MRVVFIVCQETMGREGDIRSDIAERIGMEALFSVNNGY